MAVLYDRYGGLMYGLGLKMLSDPAQAEDLLHDAFVEAWGAVNSYDPARGSVRAWLVTRMRSRALDRLRKRSRSKEELGERFETFDGVSELSDPSAAPDQALVREALQSLPEAQRAVLELGYFQGCSSSEIASRLDIPIGTVKSRVARGLAQLRKALADPKKEVANDS